MTKIGANALSPDGYSRFFVIIHLLEQVYGGSEKTVRILDIGGCSPYLQEELKKASFPFDLTILDILPKPPEIKTKYIQADATKSDLPDGAFDVVVTTDTLEHIPEEGKDAFVEACVRLSKDVCIVAAPFDTEGVHQAELLVNGFNKRLFGVGQDWLEEHFEFKKPSIRRTNAVLDRLKVSYAHFGTNNLYSWMLSSHLNLVEAKLGLNASKARRAKRLYNAELAKSVEFTNPTYRHFFVVYKNEKLASDTPLRSIMEKQEPEVFANYIHTMIEAITDRMSELVNEAEIAKYKLEDTRQQLHNERIHVQKLNEVIGQQGAELKRLEPLSRIIRFGHRVVKKAKNKLSGRS